MGRGGTPEIWFGVCEIDLGLYYVLFICPKLSLVRPVNKIGIEFRNLILNDK